MSLNQHQNNEDSDLISSEYDRYRSETIDKIDDLLLINQIAEMDSKIHKNCLAILKIMKNVQNKLYNNYELKKEEIENFIYCLKFIDTLNIFMNNSMIDSMLKLTEDISNLVHSNTELKNKDDLLHKIKYAEKSIVYFKKKTFKNLYFSDSVYLSKEIEKSLNSINQSYEYSNNFDRKIFKQMQNIFWVLQKKLTEEQKKLIQGLIDELKGTNIKSRSRRYTSYYDYNDSQNYYSTSNNYYNNNYYGYSNYNNSSQHRRSDYYDPHYKKMDLIELPDVVQNVQMQREGFAQANLTPIQEKSNNENDNFLYLNEGSERKDEIEENEIFPNQNSKQDYEKEPPSTLNDKKDYHIERIKSNKDLLRNNEKNNHQKTKRNRLDSKPDDANHNSKDVKESSEYTSINLNNKEKNNKVIYKVVEVDIKDSKSKINEPSDVKNIDNDKNDNLDQRDALKIIETPFNKSNIETVIISSTGQKDLMNSNKHYNNAYVNTNNSKSNKKHKDNYNNNQQPSTKVEKIENKNSSKKSKKNKSQHLLVEVDYSKSEKPYIESTNLQTSNENSKLENEDRNANTNEIINRDSNLTSEAEDLTKSSEKLNKDNIEIIRHYQSDYEYNCDYETGKYGKYNSKYQKNYPNYYNKQISSSKNSKTSTNIKEVEPVETITDSKKSFNQTEEKVNNDNQSVSNFTAKTDKDNVQTQNNKNVNASNNKYRNKSYSTYNSYNYHGYNNYKNTNSTVQEKPYSDKELVLTSEPEKNTKYVIKEVEFIENKAPQRESIENEINKFININKDTETLITKNPEAFNVEDQLVKSHSDLETNLNDLKLMDLKVNFQEYSKNSNNDAGGQIGEKSNLLIKESTEQINQPVVYETIKTYVNNHPYNSGGNYKTTVKNKTGKFGKYHQSNSLATNNADSVNIEDGDNYYKNPYYNNKQIINPAKDHPNNFLNKNYINNLGTESNNYYQNLKNTDNYYEKSNYNTAKKKNYSNNYKPEKNFDSNINIYNEEEPFNHRKITDFNQKDVTNKDNTNIENQFQNKDRSKYEKEYQTQVDNYDVSDNLKENLNDELFNNNNYYRNKGHSDNFNSMNNIDNRENVYNKNSQENSSKVYKDYNYVSNGNNTNFVMNKNYSYLKNEKANIMTSFQNEKEIHSNLYQDQTRNFDENKYKNKRNNTHEYDIHDTSKNFKNVKVNQNNPGFIFNQSRETDDYVAKIRGREDFYDYSNKLKNKKGKLNKSNNTNVKANHNIPQNDNNLIYQDHFSNPLITNSNLNQNKFVNGSNVNSGINTIIQNNLSNHNNIINMQNANNKKPGSTYKYSSTDIGLFSNLLGFNNKMNTNSNNSPNMMPNNIMSPNMNMLNLGMLNYIHQMNMFNQMSALNNQNNKMNGLQNAIITNNQGNNIKDSPTESNHKKSEESKIEQTDIKMEKANEEESEKIRKEDMPLINVDEKTDSLTELSINNKDVLDSKVINNKNLPNNKDNISQSDLIQMSSPKDVKPISVFNMDIEKFFQSEAKDINLQNISQLEKKKDEIINLNTDSSQNKLDNIQLVNSQEAISNAQIIENIPYKNNKEKYEFTSENETEKENLNENSSDQNDSDEEPSSDTSDSIPNEEIEAAFETFQNEIRNMHSMPIPVEADDDFYVVESDYNDENKEKVTKNNKAIFEEGDSKDGIDIKNDKNKDKDLTMNIQKDITNIRNLTDVDINSNEEEQEEDEQASDNDIYVNPNVINNNPIFNVEKENIDTLITTNNNDNENSNLKILNQANVVVDNKISEKPKSVINNQIYNNFNFYNMQMIANPNMIQYLNSFNNPKGKNTNNNSLNSFKMMENVKHINMNYPIKNINNMGLNQNYTANVYIASQVDPKNLREQTKAYTDSVKTIDPDLLKIIKNKLTENTNTNSQKNSINLPENNSTLEEESRENPVDDEAKDLLNSQNNQDNNVNENKSSNKGFIIDENKRTLIENNQSNFTDLALISNDYQDTQNTLNSEITNTGNVLNDGKSINFSSMNKNMQLQNYLMSNWANFIFRGRDSNIHREYLTLKYLEQENPMIISKNIEGFEDRVLIPVYQKLIFNVNKRKGVYFFTFNRYRKIICKVLQNSKILRKVKPYGSLMNNFMIDSGDIDICIVPNCGILEFAIYLDKIKEELISQKIAEHKLTHHTSRYMLLKVQDNQTKFVIDITVHNMLPILNTKLIRMYSIYDQRFHILGLYLKHWSKINKIHGAADNYLSSYALLVMLIHFLQNVVEPKVLPNLQKVEEKENIYEYNQNGETIRTNIYFEEDINKIKQNLLKLNQSRENFDSASSLLVKFFEYYSYNYDYYEQKITISKDKSECYKSKSDNIAFSIEDPFDNFHNPGKSMTVNSNQFNKFITAMKKEINFILNGEYLKRLDKVTSMNSSNQSAINMQIQMHMKNLQMLNNNQNNTNSIYKHNIH